MDREQILVGVAGYAILGTDRPSRRVETPMPDSESASTTEGARPEAEPLFESCDWMIAALLIAAELVLATGPLAPPPSHPVTRDFVEFVDSVREHPVAGSIPERGRALPAASSTRTSIPDPELDVRVAFGYMDIPGDEGRMVVEGTEYGLNYALDGHARSAFTSWIQRPCKRSARTLWLSGAGR